VAGVLRDRILDGDFATGDLLSKQEEMLRDTGVSMPSLREALRILETEGLITVRRGNMGGAVVHVPGPADAAYTLSLILQSQATTLDDVFSALRMVEPMCAGACASRADRLTAVVEPLERNLADAAGAIDDVEQFAMAARTFHEVLVSACGNKTMMLLVGALETLWSAHDKELFAGEVDLDSFAEPTVRKARLREHRAIVEAIRAGDTQMAIALSQSHLHEFADAEHHALLGREHRLQASALRTVRSD
jgi:DNA-binding FadR family transcriptional regulator